MLFFGYCPAGMDTADPTATFQQGLALHQQGRLDEAEAHYRFVLGTQPTHFGALHLTGLVHYQRGALCRRGGLDRARDRGQSERGRAAFEPRPRAARTEAARGGAGEPRARDELRPDVPASLNNRGNALLALNRPAEALADYDPRARAPAQLRPGAQ